WFGRISAHPASMADSGAAHRSWWTGPRDDWSRVPACPTGFVGPASSARTPCVAGSGSVWVASILQYGHPVPDSRPTLCSARHGARDGEFVGRTSGTRGLSSCGVLAGSALSVLLSECLAAPEDGS